MNGESFGQAFARLSGEAAQASGGPRKPLGKDAVPVSAIRRAPVLFSARSDGSANDHGGVPGHATDLTRVLRAKPEDARFLDALTVYEIAGHDYCVDGHHRIVAYEVAGVAGPVPVTRIGGNLNDALAASVAANAKLILPMTPAERQNAAWKLVTSGTGSKREQALWTGTSETFIADLRRLKRSLDEDHHGTSWCTLAQARQRGGEEEEWTEDAEVDEYAKRLRKAFGSKLHRRTDVIVLALAKEVGGIVIAEAVAHAQTRSDEFADALSFISESEDDDLEACGF